MFVGGGGGEGVREQGVRLGSYNGWMERRMRGDCGGDGDGGVVSGVYERVRAHVCE